MISRFFSWLSRGQLSFYWEDITVLPCPVYSHLLFLSWNCDLLHSAEECRGKSSPRWSSTPAKRGMLGVSTGEQSRFRAGSVLINGGKRTTHRRCEQLCMQAAGRAGERPAQERPETSCAVHTNLISSKCHGRSRWSHWLWYQALQASVDLWLQKNGGVF